MPKRILVTGGAGFIGSNLVIKLVELGYDVVVFDDLSVGRIENLQTVKDYIEFIRGDIVEEHTYLVPALKKGIDVIFHLAASFANELSMEHPLLDSQVNTQGTINLLQLAKDMDVKHFIYASSSSCYGNAQIPFEEGTPMKPSTPYAISKLAAEYYVKAYNDQYGLPTTSLRYFNVYGPNDYPGEYRNVIPNFFAQAFKKQALKITGVESSRDFTYVDDTIEMTIRVMMKEKAKGEVINLGMGVETKITDIAKIINELTGNSAPLNIIEPRDWDKVTRRLASTRKAKDILEYEAQTSIREGLERTYKWFMEKGS